MKKHIKLISIDSYSVRWSYNEQEYEIYNEQGKLLEEIVNEIPQELLEAGVSDHWDGISESVWQTISYHNSDTIANDTDIIIEYLWMNYTDWDNFKSVE